jgi:pilus assembly protein CpaB
MRPKSVALLVLALGCGLVASIGITQVMANRDGGSAVEGDTRDVFVVQADIARHQKVTADLLRIEQWPVDRVPEGALSTIEEIEGRKSKTPLYPGEAVLDAKLYALGEGSPGVSNEIPKGMRPVPVRVDDVSGGAKMIVPGDRVDVAVYLHRDPNKGILETSTQTLLQNVEVFAVDATTNLAAEEEGDNKAIAAKTVSLLVTPEQAVKVTMASQLGKIFLIMRNIDDDQIADLPAISPADILEGVERGTTPTTPVDVAPEPDGGLLALLGKFGKPDEPGPPIQITRPADDAERHAMRIVAGSEVRDLVLVAERSPTGEPTRRWVVDDSSYTATPADFPADPTATADPSAAGSPQPGSQQPPQDEPEPEPQPQKQD